MPAVQKPRYRAAYDSKSHVSARKVYNPYTKKYVVIRKNTVRPWALRTDGKLEVNPYKFTERERRKFKAAPIRSNKLIKKPAELRKKTMAGFKKAFFRWAHSNRNINEWGRKVSYTPYNKRGDISRVLPRRISHLINKPEMTMQEVAEFQVWLEREDASTNLQDMLFYAHYRPPPKYADGSVREDHQIFEFEDLRDKLMSKKSTHDGWVVRSIDDYEPGHSFRPMPHWRRVAAEPYEQRRYHRKPAAVRRLARRLGKSVANNRDPNYYYK